MDKDIARMLKNNSDVVDYIVEQLAEEPDLKTAEIKDRVYKKFGFQRFAMKTIILQVLIRAGRNKKDKVKSDD